MLHNLNYRAIAFVLLAITSKEYTIELVATTWFQNFGSLLHGTYEARYSGGLRINFAHLGTFHVHRNLDTRAFSFSPPLRHGFKANSAKNGNSRTSVVLFRLAVNTLLPQLC